MRKYRRAEGAMTYLECQERYPRLTRSMQWVGILSSAEAACALRDYRDARDGRQSASLMRWGGGEAVTHFGGPLRVVREAVRVRSTVRRLDAMTDKTPHAGASL